MRSYHSRVPASSTPRRRGRIWLWVVGILAVLFGLVAGTAIVGVAFAGEALEVRDELEAARIELAGIPAVVQSGDAAGFEGIATRALVHTTRADEIVQGGLWSFARLIPVVSQNADAVRRATEATHILVRDALPPSFDVLSLVQSDRIRFEGGGFNLEPFRTALTSLPSIDDAFAAAQAKIDDIDREALLPIVDDAVGQIVEVIDQTAPIAHTATAVLPTALKMLGDESPRTYLVLFQNNAEIRATGGIAAASVLVRTDKGRISLVGHESSTTFTGFIDKRLVDLPADTLALYDREFPIRSQNYTRTPNFPTSARMFQAGMAELGEPVDGVLSLDPVVLADVLSVTGPVTVDGIEMTADNVVRVLLSDTYFRFTADQAPADAFFAATSAAVFQKLVSGEWEMMKMLDVLSDSVADQRVYGWFPQEDEEQVARELGIDGAMASSNEPNTEVGIFLNDAAVSKLEYYLRSSITVTCDPGARTITTSITLTNSVDRDDLNYYIGALRTPRYGGTRSSMLLDVLYFAPPGATITSVDPAVGDARELGRTSTEGGRHAQSIAVLVDRGETRTVSYTSALPDGPLGPVAVRYSPTVTDTPVTVDDLCIDLTATR